MRKQMEPMVPSQLTCSSLHKQSSMSIQTASRSLFSSSRHDPDVLDPQLRSDVLDPLRQIPKQRDVATNFGSRVRGRVLPWCLHLCSSRALSGRLRPADVDRKDWLRCRVRIRQVWDSQPL